jgi:hypothetical protein
MPQIWDVKLIGDLINFQASVGGVTVKMNSGTTSKECTRRMSLRNFIVPCSPQHSQFVEVVGSGAHVI